MPVPLVPKEQASPPAGGGCAHLGVTPQQPNPPASLSASRSLAEQALATILADPTEARELAAKAFELAHAAGHGVDMAWALLVAGLALLRESHLTLAQDHMRRATAILREHPDRRCEQMLRHLEAQALRTEGRPGAALEILQELHTKAAERAPVDAFLTAMALGTVQSVLDHQDGALASFYAGVELARRSGNLSLEVNALNNLGSQQLDLHNLDQAVPMLRRSLAGAVALGSRRQRIFAAGNLVQCLCELGEPAEALALTREHLIGLIRDDDPPALQRDEEIAHALLLNSCWDEARERLARAPQPDVLTNPTAATRAWLLARIALAEDRAADALTLCLAHQSLVDDEAHMPLDRVRLAETIAEVAGRMGRWRLAYEQQRRAYTLRETLIGRAAKARFISLQIERQLHAAQQERDEARELAQQLEVSNASLRAEAAVNAALRDRLEALALEDPLTGLPNRRLLFQAGTALLEQSRRRKSPVALALIDLDHFKLINDRHGHDTGDRVLEGFADLLRRGFREGDLCCRYGGEEFVVMLADADAAPAVGRLRHLLAQFGQARFEGAHGEEFACSFSAGVADNTDTAGGPVTLQALLQRADAALYRAKAAGRARIDVAASAAPVTGAEPAAAGDACLACASAG